MSIKTLKEHNPELNITMIDFIKDNFDCTGGKMTPFLVKIIKDYENNSSYTFKEMLSIIFKKKFFREENLKVFDRFCEYQKENKLINKDVTSYGSWNDLRSEVLRVELKELGKQSSKEINVVYQDDEWFILKPLTFEASCKYGANTKWCTTMKDYPFHFHDYSRNGVLLYCLNKINGEKYGITKRKDQYHGINGTSCWDVEDNRIDALDMNMSIELLILLKKELNGPINYEMFSEKEKQVNQEEILRDPTPQDIVVEEDEEEMVYDMDIISTMVTNQLLNSEINTIPDF